MEEQPKKRRRLMENEEQGKEEVTEGEKMKQRKKGGYQLTFLVADGLTGDALLGLGAMKEMKMKIDTKGEMIRIGKESFSYGDKRPCFRVTTKRVIKDSSA